jgi:hypothetical protein
MFFSQEDGAGELDSEAPTKRSKVCLVICCLILQFTANNYNFGYGLVSLSSCWEQYGFNVEDHT